MYSFLRWLAGIALHWFYREIRIIGAAKIPKRAPIIIAVNHPNALVDSLIPAWIVPRRITLTAKATLFDDPIKAVILRSVGVVPLKRVQDELARRKEDPTGNGVVDRSRNEGSFKYIIDILKKSGAVLIFPEGKSHSDSQLAPLKTGLARIALQARDDHHIRNVYIVPIGLSFEDKGNPGSSVVAQVGEVLNMDHWHDKSIDTLTEEVYKRLRDISLAYVTPIPNHSTHLLKTPIAKLFAWWGNFIHSLPLNMARAQALKLSRTPDEPAMYTILYGIRYVLIFDLIQVVSVMILFGWKAAIVYGVILLVGAYCAAYARE